MLMKKAAEKAVTDLARSTAKELDRQGFVLAKRPDRRIAETNVEDWIAGFEHNKPAGVPEDQHRCFVKYIRSHKKALAKVYIKALMDMAQKADS